MEVETEVSKVDNFEEEAAEATELDEIEDDEKKKSEKVTKKGKKKKDVDVQSSAKSKQIESQPTLNIPGLKNLKLSTLTQKMIGCIVGEHVTTESPWTTISKDVIVENLYLHQESSDFFPVKDDLLEYPDNSILVGYDPSYVPRVGGELHRFYIAVTESAKEQVMAMLEEERRLAEEKLKNSINKRIFPWKSLGSEVEVDESIVKNTRPLIQLELETDIDELLKPVKFNDRNAEDVKDGYIRMGPGRQEFTGILKMRIDAAIQSVPCLTANAAQTDPGLPTNAWTQYLYDMKTAEEALQFSEIKELKSDYIFPEQNYLEKVLEYNENFDLFVNDYPLLIIKESDKEIPRKSTFKEYEAYTDVKHCNNKLISSVAWHPMWSGIVALAYAFAVRCVSAADIDLTGDEVSRDVFSKNSVLLWSFKDPLKPRLILESPREVHTLSWSPVDPNILVGGCTSGQIIIWDLKGKLEAVEENEYLTPEQQRYRLVMQSLIGWLQPQPPAQYVRPAALSNLQFSHSGRVTHIQFLPPTFEWTEDGHFHPVEVNEGKTSMQFLSTGEDGVILVWDLNKVPEDIGGPGRPKRKKARKRPSALTAQISPFKAYDRKIRPIYMLHPELEHKILAKLTGVSFRSPAIKYKLIDPVQTTKTVEKDNAEEVKGNALEKNAEEKTFEDDQEELVLKSKEGNEEIKKEVDEEEEGDDLKDKPQKEITEEKKTETEGEDLKILDELENFEKDSFTSRKIYSAVLEPPFEPPQKMMHVVTDEGESVTIKWEGFDFHKGETITTEEGVAVSLGTKVHDGPIVSCIRSPFLEDLVLTIGGRVIALWTHKFKDRPVFWKHSSVAVTCGSWSPSRPCLFYIGRSDGSIEIWDLTKSSDSPFLVQSISGKVLTCMNEHKLPLHNGNGILGVADFNTSFRLLYFPEHHKTPLPDELETLKEFISREIILRESYFAWNECFIKSNEEELAKSKAKEEETEKKHKESDLSGEQETQEKGKQLTKNRQENSLSERFLQSLKQRREKQMQRVLMEKKGLNKSDLIAKQQPIILMKQMEKVKRKKQREKIRHQQKIFDKTVAMLFPEVVEKRKEGPSQIDEFEAKLSERQSEFLTEYDNLLNTQLKMIKNNPFNKRLKWDEVFEEGLDRGTILDFSLYLRQKRMKRYLNSKLQRLGQDSEAGRENLKFDPFYTGLGEESEEEEEEEGEEEEEEEEEDNEDELLANVAKG